MTDEAKRCVESCREWYQAFSNMGKGNEPSVKELLTTADLIKSLAAELERVKQECDGLSIMLTSATSAAETYKRERDAAIRQMLEADKNNPFACSFCKHDKVCDGRLPVCGDCGMDGCPCNTCFNHSNWEWCGAKEET